MPKNKTLYLCLNGYSLANIGQYESYTIQVDGTLVLCDCNSSKQNNGNITHGMRANGTKNTGAGVAVYDGTFIMYGGKISNNASRGVDVNGGTFTMYGGEISGNTYTDNPNYNYGGGAGVRVRDFDTVQGNFAMYGGEISNNTYKGGGDGGGVYASGTGKFIIQDGKITDNHCINTLVGAYGGGLYISGAHSELRIENSTISNNTCDGEGGGIFIGGDATGSITDCTISGNNATGKSSKGGGLAFQNSTFTLEKCTITGNKTAGKGGGIFVLDNTANLTLSSDLKFSGNQDNYPADESGNLTTGTANDVFLHTGAYLRLDSTFSRATSTAPIVVTTYFTPSDNSYKKIAVDNRTTPDPTDFKYGNDSNSAIGIIAKTNNGKVELLACKHNYSTQKDETNHWQECSICGDKKDVAKHTYSTDWQTNSTKHWHECECGAKSGEADHSYSTAWKTGDGKHWHECECGQKSEEAEHSYSTAWDRDNTSHFHKCSACGDKTDIAICVYKARVTSGHQKSDATCTAKAEYWKSCVCDRESTETFESGEKNPDNHTGQLGDWQTNTDEHWKVYSCCQAKAQEGTHTWDEGKVTTPATCTTVGERTFTCAVCSATKTERIDATGHTYNQTKVEDKYLVSAATCTAKAVYYKSCVCGATDTSTAETFESGKPLGHDFSVRQYGENDHWMKCSRCDATDTKEAHSGGEATCTQKAVCEKCGQKYGDLKAHDFANGPYRYDGEQHWKKCANCDAIDTKVDHSGGTASCTAKAKCSVCGQEYGGLKAHDFANGPYRYDGEQHWKKCANCDAIDTKVDHSGGTASCTAKAKCSVCGQEYGGLKAHDFANGPYRYDGEQHWKKCANCDAIDTKEAHSGGEATCTQKAVCEKCGQEYGEKLAHSYTVQEHNEIQHWYKCANCTATTEPVAHTDFTAWKSDRSGHWHECSTCGYKTAVNAHIPDRDKATETTPQLCTECGYVIAPATHPVHTWVFVAETPATCNAAGEREHYKCTCGRTSFKNGDAYDVNEDASVLTIEKNSANHTGAPDSKWHSDSANHWQEYTCCHAKANEAAHSGGAATCTAQAVCQVCGTAYGPLAGHDWGAWKVTTPATKDAPGVETRTCAHNSAHTETRSIPKLSTAVYTVSEDTKIAQIEARVDGLDKILESNENKALVNDGKSVGVSLTVKNTASSGVSEKIKEKLAGSNLVGLRLELTVEKTVTENGAVVERENIPDTGVLLRTTITLPTELQGKSGYVVYRLHGDAVHVLTETANENGEFISISADKTQITICARLYSEYVIAYQTGGSSGGGYHPVNPTPVKATSANTGDAGVLLYGVTAALSLTGTAWLGAKSRKH